MKLHIVAITAFSLLYLSGCGDSSSPSECRLDVQQKVDKRDYQGAYNRLFPDGTNVDSSCKAAYKGEQYLVDKGIIEMGFAGLSFTDIVLTLVEASSTDSSGNAFADFVTTINNTRSSTAIVNLQNASVSFQNAFGINCSNSAELNASSYGAKEACLLSGFVDAMNAAVSISYLTDDIDQWVSALDNNGTIPEDMSASACVLNYSVQKLSSTVPLPYDCGDGTNLTQVDANVTFTSGNAYESVAVNGGAKTEYRLLGINSPYSMIATSGSCDTAFAACDTQDGTTCLPCPINQEPGSDDVALVDTIVTSLNSGTDAITTLLPQTSDNPDDQSAAEQIAKFKEEIGTDANGDINTSTLIDYLTNK